MLPRSQRLSVQEFNTVMEKGMVTHSPLFIARVLRLKPDESDGQTRISAVAPQKIFKKATQRTRLRRQIYEAIQQIIFDINSPIHAVILAKNGASGSDIETMISEIKGIFVKAGLLK